MCQCLGGSSQRCGSLRFRVSGVHDRRPEISESSASVGHKDCDDETHASRARPGLVALSCPIKQPSKVVLAASAAPLPHVQPQAELWRKLLPADCGGKGNVDHPIRGLFRL